VEQAREDIRYLRDSLELVHPNLFFHQSQARFEAALAAVAKGVSNETSDEDLYRSLAPIVASIGDGHTNLDPYTTDYQHFRDSNGRLFPLELRFANAEAVVVANYGPEDIVPVGSEVESIQGLTIERFLDVLGKYVGAEERALKTSFIARDLRADMWHAGLRAPFLVRYRDRSGREQVVRLRGTTLASIHRWDNSQAGYDALVAYRLSYADHGNVAVLTIHSFDNPDGWQSFIAHLANGLTKHRTRALVIDIRNNSGGDTGVSDALLKVFASTRFRDFSTIDTMVSSLTKKSYGKADYINIYGQEAWKTASGTILHANVDYMAPASPDALFHGKVYLLVGPGTFSTAAIFAAAAQDAHLATIVGTESGGLPTLYGELFTFTLPNSHLEVSVSTKYFVRPSGDTAPHGVIPDRLLTETVTDSAADYELQAAIDFASR
jgi:hypothetical protein